MTCQHWFTLFLIASLPLIGTASASAALVRHYELESITDGTTTADSTGNSTGTVNGTPTPVAGIIGNAFDFDSSSSENVLFDDPIYGSTNFTLSFWMKEDVAGANNGPGANWSPATNGTVLARTSGAALQTFVRGSTGAQSSGTTGLTINDTLFHNVVVTYDGSNVRTYLDGVEGSSQAFVATAGEGGPGNFAIGGRGSSERNMDGLVDDLAIWDNTLDVTEIVSITNLATTTALNYNAGNAQGLFDVFAGTTTSETISGKTWTTTEAGQLNGSPGEVVSLGNGDYGLVLDSEGGGVATKSGNLHRYAIDIDSTNGGGGPIETAADFVSLDATSPVNGASVTINNIDFSIGSADGSEINRSGGSPNPDSLRADYVYDDGDGQAVILFFGGAGDLRPGSWKVEVFIWDEDLGATLGDSIVGFRTNGGSEAIISSTVTPNENGAAITFFFESDGVSEYDLFVRENNSNLRAVLNGAILTAVPEPSTWALIACGGLGFGMVCLRRRRKASGGLAA